MKNKINIFIITSILFSGVAHSSFSRINALLSERNIDNYVEIAEHLMDEEMYFTALSFVKEYLANSTSSGSRRLEEIIDRLITEVGIHQFSVLPINVLGRHRYKILRYILAKKHFINKNYKRADKILDLKEFYSHPAYPFVLHLKAAISSIERRYDQALNTFEKCIDVSERYANRAFSKNQKRQLITNRDNCIVGIPRILFARKDFARAGKAYLNLSKSSYIWPEILFEEAWNNFYQGDYNRTLGKLVTYKAPLFDRYVNPDIFILRALSYIKLCLWGDVEKVVDNFNLEYGKEYKQIVALLKRYGKKYDNYYALSRRLINKKKFPNKLLEKILKGIVWDTTFLENYNSFQKGKKEIDTLRSINISKRFYLTRSLKNSLVLQKKLIGYYVRRLLQAKMRIIEKAKDGMGYIRLELLSFKKKQLYTSSSALKAKDRERGDVQYLKRDDNQYLWLFNGEFWADELGDYTFSLNSECK